MKASAQLPPVDPEFLLVERRPETLRAYARGLLWHLRQIRAGGEARRYPITIIKAAAVWLVELIRSGRYSTRTGGGSINR